MPTASGTWYQWCDSTTTTASTDNTWVRWVAASSGTTATATVITTSDSTDATWYAWTAGNHAVRVYPAQPTASNVEETRARLEKEAKERAEAEVRANELLDTHLNDEQRKQLKEIDAFIINLKSKQYRIRRGWAGNVDELKDGKVIAKYCIHPQVTVPYSDHMLSQKFMLETNEAEFLRIANRTPVYDGPPERPMPVAN